jgi:2-C-methyl-D-erythritol 4-phosphate cytidylyltransferase
MVEHTLLALTAVPQLDGVLVVTAPDDAIQPGAGMAGVRVKACGGDSRAQTVANGLACLLQGGAHANDWVLVHDAARCLVLPEQIQALIQRCLPDAVGGLLAAPMVDTLKEQLNEGSVSLNGATEARVQATRARAGKWLAQTPQMFRLGLLARALNEAGDHVTDESSAIEALGLHPLLVACSMQNMKVTYPEDFALAEALLTARCRGTTE